MTHILRVSLFWLGLSCSVINPSGGGVILKLGEEQEMTYGRVRWDVVLLLPLANHRTITERSAERFLKRLHDPLPYPKAQPTVSKPFLTGFI